MRDINILAVIVATASSFFLGGLWYSPALFGRAWGRAAGLGDGGPGGAGGEGGKDCHPHPARVFVVAILFSLIAATAFALMLGPRPALGFALEQGAIVGACFVAASFGINYQFADRKPLLWLIDGGYHTVQFLLFGLVLGLWH